MNDIVLIGAGIMSATLGKMLKVLNPNLKISIIESLSDVALESSDVWNNAGTGHAANCELNYTPEKNGVVDIEKALHITESFEMSKQFYSYLVEKAGVDPEEFIHPISHMSFVYGEDVLFLEKRFEKMKKHHFYKNMVFSNDVDKIKSWIPIVMEGRNIDEKVAATKMDNGTDVNFGKLTKLIITNLVSEGVELNLNCVVKDLKKEDEHWVIKYKNKTSNTKIELKSKFVFIGAGGGAILLLEKANILEAKGFGGFPVSGQWLVCNNEEIITKHNAKVYGKASEGAPPMSVPHLDTRIINGKKELLFGPYAGFSTKFLKNGSKMDLIHSIKTNNIVPMLSAGFHNMPLTKYLIHQVKSSMDEKIEELRKYYPNAIASDWEVKIAGQRVQVIKKDKKEGGILEFGTEIVTSYDGTIATLLGASPGASTAVSIIIKVIEKCFPEMLTKEWIDKMVGMIPSYGISLIKNDILFNQIQIQTNKTLKLNVQ